MFVWSCFSSEDFICPHCLFLRVNLHSASQHRYQNQLLYLTDNMSGCPSNFEAFFPVCIKFNWWLCILPWQEIYSCLLRAYQMVWYQRYQTRVHSYRPSALPLALTRPRAKSSCPQFTSLCNCCCHYSPRSDGTEKLPRDVHLMVSLTLKNNKYAFN